MGFLKRPVPGPEQKNFENSKNVRLFRGVNDTVNFNFAVSVKLHGVNDTVESDLAVLMTLQIFCLYKKYL